MPIQALPAATAPRASLARRRKSRLRPLPRPLLAPRSLLPLLAVLALLASLAPSRAMAQVEAIPAAPATFVTDRAGMLSPATHQALEQRLESYARQTGHQVLVYIGQSSGNMVIEEWAVRAFEQWRIGRKGIDDGLLVLVFAADRKVRIEVGYGLEPVVTDLVSSRVLREITIPRLRAGDAEGAVTATVDKLIQVIAAGGMPEGGPGEARPDRTAANIVMLLLLVGFLILLATNPSLALQLLYVIASSGHGGRGYHGGGRGGGFGGGGGGGGFSGGGGRSGGGGATGSW